MTEDNIDELGQKITYHLDLLSQALNRLDSAAAQMVRAVDLGSAALSKIQNSLNVFTSKMELDRVANRLAEEMRKYASEMSLSAKAVDENHRGAVNAATCLATIIEGEAASKLAAHMFMSRMQDLSTAFLPALKRYTVYSLSLLGSSNLDNKVLNDAKNRLRSATTDLVNSLVNASLLSVESAKILDRFTKE